MAGPVCGLVGLMHVPGPAVPGASWLQGWPATTGRLMMVSSSHWSQPALIARCVASQSALHPIVAYRWPCARWLGVCTCTRVPMLAATEVPSSVAGIAGSGSPLADCRRLCVSWCHMMAVHEDGSARVISRQASFGMRPWPSTAPPFCAAGCVLQPAQATPFCDTAPRGVGGAEY